MPKLLCQLTSWEFAVEWRSRFKICRLHPYIVSVMVLVLFSGILHVISHIEITGDYEGVFVFRSNSGEILDIKDDLFLGDENRLLFKLEFEPFIQLFRVRDVIATDSNFLTVNWHRMEGRGYVIDNYPDGRKLLLAFSRFRAENGIIPSGLFLGGELPFSSGENGEAHLNKTGMAFYNGERWEHIWCTANEAIASASNAGNVQQLCEWKYLGGGVIRNSSKELVLKSSHKTTIDGTPLRIDKTMIFKAADKHFVLVTRVVNVGRAEVSYRYAYGDEPWVGDYGSSAGDVGWVEGRLIRHEELLNTGRSSFAGMFDFGNDLAGENHEFTYAANFVQWLGENRPSVAYISNVPGRFSRIPGTVPLTSRSRFIGLEWGPRLLGPGRSDTFVLAIGMARKDPISDMPVKPSVDFDMDRYAFLREHQIMAVTASQ